MKFKRVLILLVILLVSILVDYAIVWPYLKTTFALFLICAIAFSTPALIVYLIVKTLAKPDKTVTGI